MQPRYKDDARRDLYSIELRIDAHKRTVRNTANKKTAAISDKVLLSLERQADELRIEITKLEDRPTRQYVASDHITFTPRTTPLSEKELEDLTLPAFLRRTRKLYSN